MIADPFQSRIGYDGSLIDLIKQIIVEYNFGEYQSHHIIPVGYEDLNIVLQTSNRKFLVKIFATSRTNEDCQRYADIIELVLKHGVRHPKLFTSSQGSVCLINADQTDIRLLVMEYIDGQTFYDLKQKPNEIEQELIIEQAALIHQIDIRPKHIYDGWAIVNFVQEHEKIASHLNVEDRELMKGLVDDFRKIDVENLPHCLVHGDIIKTNVIKSDADQIFILDFSVANYYPRILELAVLLCDLFFVPEKEAYIETYQRTLSKYQQYSQLTDRELVALPLFTTIAHAMHIIGATNMIRESGNSQESTSWLEEGRIGLRFMKSISLHLPTI